MSKLRKQEEVVLGNLRNKERDLKALLKGRKRTIPKNDKAILICPVFLRRGATGATSFASPNVQVGGRVVLISQTIREKPWSVGIELWLKEDKFIDLVRGIVSPSCASSTLGFVISLHRYHYETEDQDALEKVCNTIVQGRRLTAYCMKHFDYTIFDGDQLVDFRNSMKEHAFFSKNQLDVESDLMVVIHSKRCNPLEDIQYSSDEGSSDKDVTIEQDTNDQRNGKDE